MPWAPIVSSIEWPIRLQFEWGNCFIFMQKSPILWPIIGLRNEFAITELKGEFVSAYCNIIFFVVSPFVQSSIHSYNYNLHVSRKIYFFVRDSKLLLLASTSTIVDIAFFWWFVPSFFELRLTFDAYSGFPGTQFFNFDSWKLSNITSGCRISAVQN